VQPAAAIRKVCPKSLTEGIGNPMNYPLLHSYVTVNVKMGRQEKFFAIKGVATAREAPRLYHYRRRCRRREPALCADLR
jgi:hypothetical protein